MTTPMLAKPFSYHVEIGIRIPVLIVCLVAAFVVLALARRIGSGPALLGGAGLLLVALDSALTLGYDVYLHQATSFDSPGDFDNLIRIGNALEIADAVLTSLGVLLVAMGFAAARRPGVEPQ